MIYANRCFLKITFIAGGDIQEFLRVDVHQGKPGALNLHHNAMPFFKCVHDIIHIEFYFCHLNRNQCLWFFITVSEFSPKHFGPLLSLYAGQLKDIRMTYIVYSICGFKIRFIVGHHIN